MRTGEEDVAEPVPVTSEEPSVASQRGGSPSGAVDRVGEDTLELFREHGAYNEFLLDRLLRLARRPLAGRVLEVGCGIGNITSILLRPPAVTYLRAIDMDPAYVERLEREIVDPRLAAEAVLAEEFCPAECTEGAGRFDVIFSSNVLEHIDDHERVLANFARMLAPDGVGLILVPAHPRLYSTLDENLSHFRRYSRRSFADAASRAGLRVAASRYFNPIGALGWWLNGRVLKRAVLPPGQLAFYAKFAIPISRIVDALNPFPVGVSLLAVLERG